MILLHIWKKQLVIGGPPVVFQGTGSFFTDGGTFKSDNGKHESDLYYMSLRPLEGYPQMHFPSQRTKTGGHFTS
jgi:hypothetical protein